MEISELIDRVEDFGLLPMKLKVKYVSFFYTISKNTTYFKPADINMVFDNENLKKPSNISQDFIQLVNEDVLIRDSHGFYCFERGAKKDLTALFIGDTHKQQVSTTLRSLTSKMVSKEQKAFLEEAIMCYEVKCYRAAVIFTWVLTMDTLYEYVLKHKLVEFNQAIQSQGQYKKVVITNKDNFSDLKEGAFIELLRVGKIISGDLKRILEEKLGVRNTCSHPNSIIIKETKALNFIEDLVENALSKYC